MLTDGKFHVSLCLENKLGYVIFSKLAHAGNVWFVIFLRRVTMKRIALLGLCLLVLGISSVFSGGTGEGGGASAAKPQYTYLCTAIRSLSNPYHQQVIAGMKLYAKSMGIPDEYVLTITHDNNTEKLLRDMQALIAKYDGNIVFQVDPNQMSDLISIAEMCEEAGVYWVSIWKRPDEVKVSDYDHWVAAINFGDYESGYLSAKSLFESMGGKGKVWMLDGTYGHASALLRRNGANQAMKEFPGITLAGYEDCSFEKTKAFNSINNAISANPDLGGIWGANDNMAVGGIEALRAKGVAGKVKVAGVNAIPPMIDAIRAGEAVATISTDPLWQGGITFAMAIDAKNGKYDPKKVGEDRRYWLASVLLITSANVEDYFKNYINGSPKFDYSDYYAGKYIGGAENAQGNK
jgi:ribose transport system substrate-binding protein